MKKNLQIILLSGAIVLFFQISCGFLRKSTGLLQSKATVPGYIEYFELGKQEYENGNLDEAVDALQQSLILNPGFIPAAEALGYAFLDKGGYSDALHYLSIVLTDNAYSVKARMGIGRIYLAQNNFEKAVGEFDIALGVNPMNAEAHFYRGMALRQKGDEYLSAASFVRAVINDESYRATISGLIPLTEPRISNLFKKEYLSLESKSSINRAELAALLVTIIQDNRVYVSGGPGTSFQQPQMQEMSIQAKSITDVPENYWAKNEIVKAVNAGLIELYPDRTFRPEQEIQKVDFASLLQMIVVRIRNKPGLETNYIGKPSPFNDINSSHWAYNAVRLSVELTLLNPQALDHFGLSDPVPARIVIQSLERTKKIM